MNPLFHTGFSISDSLKSVLKSVLIYETIIWRMVIVDSTVLSLINGHEISIDYFQQGDDGEI